MRKIAINVSTGGFQLSTKAQTLFAARKRCDPCKSFAMCPSLKRDDPVLISIIEELGYEANAPGSNIRIFCIPSEVEFYIVNYNIGKEMIAKKNHYWQ